MKLKPEIKVIPQEEKMGMHESERFIRDLEKLVPVQKKSVSQGLLPCGQLEDLQKWREGGEDKATACEKSNNQSANNKEGAEK